MSQSTIQITRLVDGEKRRTTSIAEALEADDLARETWLFACPHDDDIIIGGGLWLAAAIEAGVGAHLVIATDGRMGYCTAAQRATIVQTREAETYAAYQHVGLPREQIHFLGFPDCNLAVFQGRRPLRPGDAYAPRIADHTGLTNSFTHILRKIRPDRVVVTAPTDLHPDHQIVHSELMICLFHASGAIWPELGEPAPLPVVYEQAVYCDFAEPPDMQLKADQAMFDRKLAAIAEFRSQQQIGQLVDRMREAGPIEYLREADFHLYDPSAYHGLFD